ncbi:MAG: AbiV family abortive infection protein [SAR324 cluster bacterium]|nr:AbiV family abortive infection protein [SAR324 cluster bacterium]
METKREDELFECLQAEGDSSITIRRISEGIHACIKNIGRLLSDAVLLARKRRFASSIFLIQNIKEEIGKLYILIDYCRLDNNKHSSTAKNLCKSFYNHVNKIAYYTLLQDKDLPGVSNMQEALECFLIATTRYWPGDIESGVPDLPDEATMWREWPLYVCYVKDGDYWQHPTNNTYSIIFEANPMPPLALIIPIAHNIFKINRAGSFTEQILTELRSVYNDCYFNESTPNTEIEYREKLFDQRLAKLRPINPAIYQSSIFTSWPIYHFTTMKRPTTYPPPPAP